MAKYIKSIFFIFICFACGLIAAGSCSADEIVDKKYADAAIPVLTELGGGQSGKLSLSGATATNTDVLIYLNGIYMATVEPEIKPNDTGQYNFSYINNTTFPEGSYEIMLIARDKGTLVLSPPLCNIEFVVPSLPAPTMIDPDGNDSIGKVKPLIVGLTVSGTYVKVYIDGVYNGRTAILEDESGTASFAYEPFLNLNKGIHHVWAVSEDKGGRKSQVSRVLTFKIENPMPAPIIIKPLNVAAGKQPVIAGVAKNDSLVKVFIDHRLAGQFKVENDKSGTANFAFKAPFSLAEGDHLIYTIAIDSNGKESVWSNISRVIAKRILEQANAPRIEFAAREENSASASEIGKQKKAQSESVSIASSDEITKDAEAVAAKANTEKEVENALQARQPNISGDTGLINENKEKQSKLKLNTIIFIIFLLSAVGWIVWANRELNKEKKFQEFAGDGENAENKNKIS